MNDLFLSDEQELKQQITRLQGYRSVHLTRLRHIPVYKRLARQRERQRGDRNLLTEVLNYVRVRGNYVFVTF